MHEEPEAHDRRAAASVSARRRWIEGAVLVVLWAIVAWLDVTQQAFDPRAGGGPLHPGETLYSFLEHVPWLLATPFIFWLTYRFSLDRAAWPWQLALHLAVAVPISAGIDLVNHVTWNAVVTAHTRPASIGAVMGGFHFLPEMLIYFVIFCAGTARNYFLRYQERIDEAARLRAESAELQAHSARLQAQLADARLEALRMQINPHFLFNTLNAISSYLEQDPRGVRRMIARLSELLRYTLDGTDTREVPLREEIGFIDSYLELQRMRFEERLETTLDVDPNVLDALVPNLLLQPLVENAIKHGIGDREEGGRVDIAAWREGPHLHLRVRDDGPGMAANGGDGMLPAKGIGLRNTRERLETLYGPDQELDLEHPDGGGLAAHIVLPFRTSADHYAATVSS